MTNMTRRISRIAVLLFISLALVTLISNKVYAEDTFEMQITSDNQKVKPGETIKVKITANGVEGFTDGSTVLLSTIEFDKNIFEEIKEADFNLLNDWGGLVYNEENGKLVIDKRDIISNPEQIMEITFKVKQDAKNTDTQIKLIESAIGNAKAFKELKCEEAKIDIKVAKGNNSIIIIAICFVIGTVVGVLLYKKKKANK